MISEEWLGIKTKLYIISQTLFGLLACAASQPLAMVQKLDSSSSEDDEDNNDLALAMGFSGFGSSK